MSGKKQQQQQQQKKNKNKTTLHAHYTLGTFRCRHFKITGRFTSYNLSARCASCD